jgi:hypothetical protein
MVLATTRLAVGKDEIAIVSSITWVSENVECFFSFIPSSHQI